MSDAADFTAAFKELKRRAQADAEPVLTYGDGTTIDPTKDLDAILVNNKRGVRWSTVTYVYGDVVYPTVRNGHRYMVITAGTAVTEPTWPTDPESSITSGAEFQEIGPDSGSVYDIRGAIREAWELKMERAAELNEGDEKTIFDHCQEMANSFATPMIA